MRFALPTLSAVAVLAFASSSALAQDFPTKPVRIIVGSTAGGSIDTPARIVAQALAVKWGQPVVVENRPGASEMIGASAVAKSPADGYTLFMASSVPYTINQFVFAKLPYDPDTSFAHVVLVARNPMAIIASNKAPFDSVASLVNYGKANPGVLSWASPGQATINHISGEWFAAEHKFKAVHVPYKGGPAATNAVVSGELPYAVVSLVQAIPFSKAGSVKLLAVSTAQRTPLAPGVPTVAELGIPDLDAAVVAMMSAPAGTPPAIISKIAADVNSVLQQPAIREQFATLGSEALGSSPVEIDAHITSLRAKVSKIIAQNNIKAD